MGKSPKPTADVRALRIRSVGCVGGAVLVQETEQMARAAGLTEIRLDAKRNYLDAMTDWKDPLYVKILQHLPPGAKASDYVTSLEVSAKKPAAATKCC